MEMFISAAGNHLQVTNAVADALVRRILRAYQYCTANLFTLKNEFKNFLLQKKKNISCDHRVAALAGLRGPTGRKQWQCPADDYALAVWSPFLADQIP